MQDQQRDPVAPEATSLSSVPDLSGENTQKLADRVKESMKKVPAGLQGDLENLLTVVNETAVDGKTFDENQFKTAMEPIGAWVAKNCSGQ